MLNSGSVASACIICGLLISLIGLEKLQLLLPVRFVLQNVIPTMVQYGGVAEKPPGKRILAPGSAPCQGAEKREPHGTVPLLRHRPLGTCFGDSPTGANIVCHRDTFNDNSVLCAYGA